MDRPLVYPGSIPLDTDLLHTNQFTMVALGFLAQAAFGDGPLFDGLLCTQTTPPSMTVQVGPGWCLANSTLEALPYGSLPADTTDPLVKMGINIHATPFALVAPTISGQSINYLIQGTLQETDTNPVVLPYYNVDNPAQAFEGPGGTGSAQNTQRIQRVALQLVAGVPATTGSQQTPAADAGWTPLYVITVNASDVTVATTAITKVSGSPFVGLKIPAISGSTDLSGYATDAYVQAAIANFITSSQLNAALANFATTGQLPDTSNFATRTGTNEFTGANDFYGTQGAISLTAANVRKWTLISAADGSLYVQDTTTGVNPIQVHSGTGPVTFNNPVVVSNEVDVSGTNATLRLSATNSREWTIFSNGADGALYIQDTTANTNPVQIAPGTGNAAFRGAVTSSGPITGLGNVTATNGKLRATLSSGGDANAATLLSEFGFQHASGIGYAIMPSGFVIQWGTIITSGSGEMETVTFPLVFPHEVFLVLAGEGNVLGWGSTPQPTILGTQIINTAGFGLSSAWFPAGAGAPSYATGITARWVALGY